MLKIYILKGNSELWWQLWKVDAIYILQEKETTAKNRGNWISLCCVESLLQACMDQKLHWKYDYRKSTRCVKEPTAVVI